MNKLVLGGLIAAGAFYFLGNADGKLRHSGGSGFAAGGAVGVSGYAKSSGGAVKGIGNAAGGILK